MALNSVVIMANNVGCVCSAASPVTTNGAPGGGMAVLMMDEGQRKREPSSSQPVQPAQDH